MRERERVLPEDGPGSPPRVNGELVFSAPWEGRIFGLTLALFESGRFEWPEFQSRLVQAIRRHEADRGEGTYQYYGCWLEAFRELATEKGWLDPVQLDSLERDLASRPPGHDH